MEILHPYLTLIYVLLIVYSYKEVYAEEYINFKSMWWVVVLMIIVGGLRTDGPDFRSYRLMYSDFGMYMPLDLKLIENNFWNVEWLYVIYNIVMYNAGFSLMMFVLITAIFTLTTKYYVFEKNSAYPALSMLLYITPAYFMGDMGHLRQAIAICLCLLAFEPIKKRKFWLFLPIMYIAQGFHSSSFIFIFAYFIAVVPLNRFWIGILVGTSIVLSPFEIYNSIPFLDSIAPSEVYEGFTDYNQIVEENPNKIKFSDLFVLFFLYFIFFHDKEANEYIPYYEYMRNLVVVGVCIYFIFRQSPIFSTRLVSYYMVYSFIAVPNILAAVQNIRLRRTLFGILLFFVVGYYFVFASMQGKRYFTPRTYQNHILIG